MNNPPILAKASRQGLSSSICIGIVSILVIVSVSSWPEIYDFASNREASLWSRLLSAPVHLSDDVMISLRSGNILRDVGYPAFNRHDLAQASTSYASPYLFSLLRSFVGDNIAILLYAGLGALSVAATASIVFFNSRSFLNGLIAVSILLFSTTSREYSLNGWDHVFQALFLVIAASFFLSGYLDRKRLLAISSCLAIACLWRPDAAVFSVAIMAYLFLETKKKSEWILFAMLPFLGILLPFLMHNLYIFGHATPTTARLKIGASPSIQYAFKYLIKNGFFQLSAITIVAFLSFFYVRFLWKLGNGRSHTLVLSAVVTSLVSAANSDAFGAGRMFWSSACVLVVVFCSLAPPLFRLEPGIGLKTEGLIKPVRTATFYVPGIANAGKLGRVLSVVLVFMLAMWAGNTFVHNATKAIVAPGQVYSSPTASQYVLARWINYNLKPTDGSIGFFYLGVSYHLERFEIADFLGKADELIAGSKKKWGPPGHNKWDISASIHKWRPQAIVPAGPSDFSRQEVVEDATISLAEMRDYGFAPALIVNKDVLLGYLYCSVKPFRSDLRDKWGLFIRRDIAEKSDISADCKEPYFASKNSRLNLK